MIGRNARNVRSSCSEMRFATGDFNEKIRTQSQLLSSRWRQKLCASFASKSNEVICERGIHAIDKNGIKFVATMFIHCADIIAGKHTFHVASCAQRFEQPYVFKADRRRNGNRIIAQWERDLTIHSCPRKADKKGAG